MPIPVACRCGKSFAANDHLAGKTVKCPGCQQPLAIPAAGQASAQPRPQAGKPAAPRTADGKIVVACRCGAKFAAGAELAGKQVKCPKCGQPLTVGAGHSAGAPAAGAAPKTPAQPQAAGGMIPVVCRCGAKFAAKPELRGKAVRCPKCSQPLTVGAAAPATAGAAAGAAAATASTPSSGGGGLGLDDLLDEVGVKAKAAGEHACPSCGAPLAPEAVLCVECGYNRQTGKKVQVETIKKVEAKKLGPPSAAAKTGGKAGGGRVQSSIPWETEGGDWGAIFSTARAAIFEPEAAFAKLSPDGFSMALRYVVSTVVAVNLILAPLRLIAVAGGQADIAVALADMAGGVFGGIVGAIISFFLFGSIYHLCLKVIGAANQPISTTLQVYGYVTGGFNLMMICPCLIVLAPLVTFYSLPFGMASAHKISKGQAYGALALYLVALIGIIVGLVFALMALVGSLLYFAQPR